MQSRTRLDGASAPQSMRGEMPIRDAAAEPLMNSRLFIVVTSCLHCCRFSLEDDKFAAIAGSNRETIRGCGNEELVAGPDAYDAVRAIIPTFVDDAPFYYSTYGGEFETKVKISGDYKVRFDQACLMIRIDKENYLKAGIEYVDGKYNLSCVVTHHTSDWSVISLDKPVEYVWIKAVRRLDAIEIFYSFDDKNYIMMRNCWMEDNTPVQIGVAAACPDGEGFKAKFEDFQVKHLPDQRRLEWLKLHAE